MPQLLELPRLWLGMPQLFVLMFVFVLLFVLMFVFVLLLVFLFVLVFLLLLLLLLLLLVLNRKPHPMTAGRLRHCAAAIVRRWSHLLRLCAEIRALCVQYSGETKPDENVPHVLHERSGFACD